MKNTDFKTDSFVVELTKLNIEKTLVISVKLHCKT